MRLESVFLLALLLVLMVMGPATLLDGRLHHDVPYAALASDNFWHITATEQIVQEGSYRTLPASMAHGYDDVAGFNPLGVYQLSAMLAVITGLPVHDTVLITALFFVVLACFLMYLLIRDYSPQLAMLSAPFFVLVFSLPFIVSLLFGQWLFLAGTAFFLAVLLALTLKNNFWPLALALAGLAIAHTSEYVYALAFIAAVSLYRLLIRRFSFADARKTLLAIAFSVFFSAVYLLTFLNTYAKFSTYTLFEVVTSVSNFTNVHFSHFGILRFLLFAGLALALFLTAQLAVKRKPLPVILPALLFFFLLGVANYLGLGYLAFQTRLFWPVYVAALIGLPLFFALKFIPAPKKLLVPAISLVLLAALFLVVDIRPAGSAMSPGYWQQLEYLREQTPQDAKVLFLYGDQYFGGFLWVGMREQYQVSIGQLPETFTGVESLHELPIYSNAAADSRFAYRKNIFSFGYHGLERNLSISPDICDYDFVVLQTVGRSQDFVNFNVQTANILLQDPGITLAMQNEEGAILHNANPGGECIGQ